jgi:hypothetical protein
MAKMGEEEMRGRDGDRKEGSGEGNEESERKADSGGRGGERDR